MEELVITPWAALALTVPVLLAGERLVRRVRPLERFNIPASVAGGLLVALLVLAGNVTGLFDARFVTGVSARWWTWLVCTGPEWAQSPVKNVSQPFLVAFFACVGLNASWTLVKRGSAQVLLFLGLSSVLAVMQNLIGLCLAGCMGVPRALGLICGSVAMTGGHGTVLGFAPEFEAAGLAGASVMGVAAATFGLVAGGLIGAPVGGALIRKRGLRPLSDAGLQSPSGMPAATGSSTRNCRRADTRYGMTFSMSRQPGNGYFRNRAQRRTRGLENEFHARNAKNGPRHVDAALITQLRSRQDKTLPRGRWTNYALPPNKALVQLRISVRQHQETGATRIPCRRLHRQAHHHAEK